MGRAYRVWSAVLGRDVWIAETEETARELQREDETNLVFTLEEARCLLGASEELIRAIAVVKGVFPGAHVRKVRDDG